MPQLFPESRVLLNKKGGKSVRLVLGIFGVNVVGKFSFSGDFGAIFCFGHEKNPGL